MLAALGQVDAGAREDAARRAGGFEVDAERGELLRSARRDCKVTTRGSVIEVSI